MTNKKRILIAVQTNQQPDIFTEYFKSLQNLVIPEDCEVDYFFVLHNMNDNAQKLIPIIEGKAEYFVFEDGTTKEFNVSGKTHEWQGNNFKAVVNMKNIIIDRVLEYNYDYWFLVDSDIILHPNTLCDLLSHNKDMIAEGYITEWLKDSGGYGYNFWTVESGAVEDYSRYQRKGIYRVFGTGACCLYSNRLLKAIKNTNPIPYLNRTLWEDWAVSIKAVVMGFDIYVSTFYPCLHLYRQDIYLDYINGTTDINTYDFTDKGRWNFTCTACQKN